MLSVRVKQDALLARDDEVVKGIRARGWRSSAGCYWQHCFPISASSSQDRSPLS